MYWYKELASQRLLFKKVSLVLSKFCKDYRSELKFTFSSEIDWENCLQKFFYVAIIMKLSSYEQEQYVKNSFIKIYWPLQVFEVDYDFINKKQKYITLPDQKLPENLVLVFGFYERKKSDKRELATKKL